MKNNDSNHLESDQELINIFDIDNIPESELGKAYVDYEKVKGNNMQKTIIGTGIFNLDTIVVREYPEWPAMRPFVEKEVLQEVGGTCGNVMCMLATMGWKWGYIDKTGREVVPCKYEDARCFSGGLARVEMDGNWMYIDTTGREVI